MQFFKDNGVVCYSAAADSRRPMDRATTCVDWSDPFYYRYR